MLQQKKNVCNCLTLSSPCYDWQHINLYANIETDLEPKDFLDALDFLVKTEKFHAKCSRFSEFTSILYRSENDGTQCLHQDQKQRQIGKSSNNKMNKINKRVE